MGARPDPRRARVHLAVSFALVASLVFALSRPVPTSYGAHELIGALFLVAAILSVRADDDDPARYGIALSGLFPGAQGDPRSLVRTLWEAVPGALREAACAALVALVVLPVYALFWPWFNHVPQSRHFTLDAAHARDIAVNLLAVALPEEMYFRGYVQTRAADALAVAADGSAPLLQRMRAMAVPVMLASVLFALVHVAVEVTLPRAVVFFPGLLFGAVRVWRGGIGAAVVLHAASNVFEAWMEGR